MMVSSSPLSFNGSSDFSVGTKFGLTSLCSVTRHQRMCLLWPSQHLFHCAKETTRMVKRAFRPKTIQLSLMYPWFHSHRMSSHLGLSRLNYHRRAFSILGHQQTSTRLPSSERRNSPRVTGLAGTSLLPAAVLTPSVFCRHLVSGLTSTTRATDFSLRPTSVSCTQLLFQRSFQFLVVPISSANFGERGSPLCCSHKRTLQSWGCAPKHWPSAKVPRSQCRTAARAVRWAQRGVG